MFHYNFLGPPAVLIRVAYYFFGLVHTHPATAAITDAKRFFQAHSIYIVHCKFVHCIYSPSAHQLCRVPGTIGLAQYCCKSKMRSGIASANVVALGKGLELNNNADHKSHCKAGMQNLILLCCRDEASEMFAFGYDEYLLHAFPKV